MEKRESLAARYERVLGRSLDQDQETEGSHLQSSVPRRREQVLQAQRVHRHRTQQYIRELEKEVFYLRDENEALLQRLNQSHVQMSKMKAILAQDELFPTIDSQMQACDVLTAQKTASFQSTPVQVDLTALADMTPQGSCENHPAEIVPRVYKPSSSQLVVNEHLQPLSDSQAAIDFVLTLETPCLAHVKHAHLGYSTGTTPRGIDYNSGPGHLLSTSALLTHHYASDLLTERPLHLPSSDIERLLAASARLRLDDEITPVQIWQRLRVRYSELPKALLDRLTATFANYIYCNSFGAVVEKITAIAILEEMLQSIQLPPSCKMTDGLVGDQLAVFG